MHVAPLVLAALAAAAAPPAGGPSPAADPAAEGARTIPPEAVSGEEPPNPKLLGVLLSAGAPDGFAASAFVRPLPWLRLEGGPMYNVLSFGLQAGVTFMPWPGRITPTLRLGVGQFFDSDLRDELGDVMPDSLDASLESFGYHFYSAQLGVEIGDDDGWKFFARAGLAWLRSEVDSATFREGDTTVTANRNDLSATVPGIQLGMLLHLW